MGYMQDTVAAMLASMQGAASAGRVMSRRVMSRPSDELARGFYEPGEISRSGLRKRDRLLRRFKVFFTKPVCVLVSPNLPITPPNHTPARFLEPCQLR